MTSSMANSIIWQAENADVMCWVQLNCRQVGSWAPPTLFLHPAKAGGLSHEQLGFTTYRLIFVYYYIFTKWLKIYLKKLSVI